MSNLYQELEAKIKDLEERLEYSHANNKIINKNLVLKFEECDALKEELADEKYLHEGTS